jgi:hypothetical protein
MIVQNAEALLVVGIAGLYLYDSALLLASNEVLLTPSRKGTWTALFGSDSFLLLGKEPCVPSPWLPHRPLYRFAWNKEGLVGPSQPWTPPGNEYAVLAPPIWMMALALFLLIPLGLFSRLGHLAIASGVVLFYLNALLALTMAWLKRGVFQITARRFAALAFECLTCPPFALNLTRHISLTTRPSEDFLSVAHRLLPRQARKTALNKAIVRVKNEIDWEDEGTARAETLNIHLQHLLGESATCQATNS